MKYSVNAEFLLNDGSQTVSVQNNTVTLSNGSELMLEKGEGHPNLYFVNSNDNKIPVIVHVNSKGEVEITMKGYKYQLLVHDDRNLKFLTMLKSSDASKNQAQKVIAPMPGLIKQVYIKEAQSVKKGENLFVLEAMKMENIIKSPITGIINSISTNSGTAVEKGNILCVIGSL